MVKLHIPSVRALDDNNNKLIEDMENAISKSKLVRSDFETLNKKLLMYCRKGVILSTYILLQILLF